MVDQKFKLEFNSAKTINTFPVWFLSNKIPKKSLQNMKIFSKKIALVF